jgi:hypothetical protein
LILYIHLFLYDRYGDMYPVTVIGRIFTCLCAFVGAGMMGMLVSVLVNRYQRVHNRKMYIPEQKVSSVEFHRLSNSENDTETGFTSRKSSRIRQMSSSVSRRLSLVQRKLKNDQRRASSQSYRVNFAISFDGENIDNNKAGNIVTAMKEKVTEAVSDAANGINLKLIGNKNNKIWTTLTSDSPHGSVSNLMIESNAENTKTSRSQAF